MTNCSHCLYFHADHACASLTIGGCGGVREFYGLTDKCISALGHVRGTPICVCVKAFCITLIHTRYANATCRQKEGVAAASYAHLQQARNAICKRSHIRAHIRCVLRCVCGCVCVPGHSAFGRKQCGNVATWQEASVDGLLPDSCGAGAGLMDSGSLWGNRA